MPGLVEVLANAFKRPMSAQKGRSEGSANIRDVLEDMIYRAGTSKLIPEKRRIVDPDRVYLRQFLNPGKDIIPRTPLRPATKVKDAEKYDWRDVARDPITWDDITPPLNLAGLGNWTGSGNVGPFKPSGLQSEDLPYSSIYDLWDFDSPNVSPMVRVLMNMVGRPYHVYRRSYVPSEPGGK